MGYQSILFGIFTKTFAISEGLHPPDPRMDRFFKLVNLERGLIFGSAAMLIGLALLAAALKEWQAVDFGALNYPHTMRHVIPGVTLVALGFQTILSSFFISLLGLHRR